MKIRKYIVALLLLSFNYSYAQAPIDPLQLLKDVNGGGVAFTAIAANAVTFGNGFGADNMAFISKLRAFTTLPITLSSFKSAREANAVKLTWTTSSERNSSHFEILKSTDGTNFFKVGNVKASGTAAQNVNYNFRDANPASGTSYYQLQMVDLDGTVQKSIIVSVNIDLDKADFKVFTDPKKGSVSLNIFSNRAKSAVFEVYDLSGSRLLRKNLTLQNGSNTFEFKLTTNAKMIIVKLNSEGDKQIKKLFY